MMTNGQIIWILLLIGTILIWFIGEKFILNKQIIKNK